MKTFKENEAKKYVCNLGIQLTAKLLLMFPCIVFVFSLNEKITTAPTTKYELDLGNIWTEASVGGTEQHKSDRI